MIIEGKHLAVGQGIFVSDIQDGSAAEQVISRLYESREFYFNEILYNIAGWIENGWHDPGR